MIEKSVLEMGGKKGRTPETRELLKLDLYVRSMLLIEMC